MSDSLVTLKMCYVRRRSEAQLAELEKKRQAIWVTWYQRYLDDRKHWLWRWLYWTREMELLEFVDYTRSTRIYTPDMHYYDYWSRLSKLSKVASCSTGAMMVSIDDLYLLTHETF